MFRSERFVTLKAMLTFLNRIDPHEWSFVLVGGTYVLVWREPDE